VREDPTAQDPMPEDRPSLPRSRPRRSGIAAGRARLADPLGFRDRTMTRSAVMHGLRVSGAGEPEARQSQLNQGVTRVLGRATGTADSAGQEAVRWLKAFIAGARNESCWIAVPTTCFRRARRSHDAPGVLHIIRDTRASGRGIGNSRRIPCAMRFANHLL